MHPRSLLTVHQQQCPREPAKPSSEAQIYASVPLPLGSSDSIRLLRILDNTSEDHNAPISCELIVASMSDSYIALSYMWGDAEATETIILNGAPFKVRRNLWDFLDQRRKDQRQSEIRKVQNEHHRPGAAASYLWVDALCIDQASTSERNHQVAMMRRIYASAAYVISWLGAGSRVLKLWDQICAFASDPSSYQLHQEVSAGTLALENDYFELYRHPYWSRAWILQECILASELRVQYGSQQVLDTVFLDYGLNNMQSTIIPVMHADAIYVLQTRAEWRDPSTRTYFCPWRDAEFDTYCSDSRDRIFSAVAIMDPAVSIVPDYSKTAEELFIGIADRHIPWDSNRLSHLRRLLFRLDLDADQEMYKEVDAGVDEKADEGMEIHDEAKSAVQKIMVAAELFDSLWE